MIVLKIQVRYHTEEPSLHYYVIESINCFIVRILLCGLVYYLSRANIVDTVLYDFFCEETWVDQSLVHKVVVVVALALLQEQPDASISIPFHAFTWKRGHVYFAGVRV